MKNKTTGEILGSNLFYLRKTNWCSLKEDGRAFKDQRVQPAYAGIRRDPAPALCGYALPGTRGFRRFS